jgi:hypothetical protein
MFVAYSGSAKKHCFNENKKEKKGRKGMIWKEKEKKKDRSRRKSKRKIQRKRRERVIKRCVQEEEAGQGKVKINVEKRNKVGL